MTPSIRLGVYFGPGQGKRFLNVEYPFDGTPEDFDRAFELCRVAFHSKARAGVRPCGYEGPWAREQKREATGSVARVKTDKEETCRH